MFRFPTAAEHFAVSWLFEPPCHLSLVFWYLRVVRKCEEKGSRRTRERYIYTASSEMCWVHPVYLSGYVIGELETQWMAVVMFFISGISGFVLRHVEYLLRTKQVIVMLFYYFQAMYFFVYSFRATWVLTS